MDNANDFTAFHTNGVNMKVPGELICQPHTQKFGRMHTIDRQAIDKIRERILLSGYNHHFCFGGYCSEVVIGKPCIDDVDV